MAKLNIGDTIFQLRKKQNITQEKLADMVGVSAGAVSKWETGNSMPDISLLSALARALNTSLDILLSFRQELSEKEVINIKQELINIFLHEGYTKGEMKCLEYLTEYPNSMFLKFSVAGLLQMYLMMADNRSDEYVKSKLEHALDLFSQVADSGESRYAPTALFCIAGIQMSLENYGESEKALDRLPKDQINPMTLYPSIYLKQDRDDEAMNLCSRSLLQQLNQIYLSLSTMANISKKRKDYDKALIYLNAVNTMQDMFKMGLYYAQYNCARLYMEAGNMNTAAEWFGAYVKNLLDSGYDYHDNPFFENIELEVKPDAQKIIRKKLLQSIIDEEEFKSLSGIFEYENAINKLKAALSKM